MVDTLPDNNGRETPMPAHIRKQRGFLFVLASLFCLLLAAGAPAWAGMDLMTEDALSDITAKTGLSLALKAQLQSGHIMLNTSLALDLQGIEFSNWGSNKSWGYIGNQSAPAKIDIGTAGGNTLLRLLLPNGYQDTLSVPSLYSNTLFWARSPSGGTNIGSLAIVDIYQNQSSFSLWAHNNGLSGMLWLEGEIGELILDPDKSTNVAVRGVYQDIYLSSSPGGSITAPTMGSGKLKLGVSTASPMTMDAYTTSAAGTFSMLRWDITVTGSIRIRNAQCSVTSVSTVRNYGPIIADYASGGFIRVTFPYIGANELYFE